MRRVRLVAAACALLLVGCSREGDSAKRDALNAYDTCMGRAAATLDDGTSDAQTIARAISPMCADEYRKVVAVNNTGARPAFEAAMQAKQIDFATTLVLNQRRTRASR